MNYGEYDPVSVLSCRRHGAHDNATVMLSIIMLSVNMASVIMLSVIMLIVVTPNYKVDSTFQSLQIVTLNSILMKIYSNTVTGSLILVKL